MYVCGPRSITTLISVTPDRWWYSIAFIRCLSAYPNVVYARNITDIDDKIIQAAWNGAAISRRVRESSRRSIVRIWRAARPDPTIEPMATEHIAEMIALTERLIRGATLIGGGHVLFAVESMPELWRAERPQARRHAGRGTSRGRRLQASPG